MAKTANFTKYSTLGLL